MPSTVMSRRRRQEIAEQQKARQKERDKIARERKEAAQFGAQMSPTASKDDKARARIRSNPIDVRFTGTKQTARVIAAGEAVKAKQNKKSDDAKAARTRAATSGKKKTPTAPPSRPKAPGKKYNVGVSKGGVSFREAFKYYRGLGQASFTWNGKKYTTNIKKAKPTAKISTPTPADFTAAGPKKLAPKKKTTTKSKDPRKGFSSKATPGSNLPPGAIRKFTSKRGYNNKKEIVRKIDGKLFVFKKGS